MVGIEISWCDHGVIGFRGVLERGFSVFSVMYVLWHWKIRGEGKGGEEVLPRVVSRLCLRDCLRIRE